DRARSDEDGAYDRGTDRRDRHGGELRRRRSRRGRRRSRRSGRIGPVMRIHISTPIDEATNIVTMFQAALPEADIALVDGMARDSSDPTDADYVVTGYRN